MVETSSAEPLRITSNSFSGVVPDEESVLAAELNATDPMTISGFCPLPDAATTSEDSLTHIRIPATLLWLNGQSVDSPAPAYVDVVKQSEDDDEATIENEAIEQRQGRMDVRRLQRGREHHRSSTGKHSMRFALVPDGSL